MNAKAFDLSSCSSPAIELLKVPFVKVRLNLLNGSLDILSDLRSDFLLQQPQIDLKVVRSRKELQVQLVVIVALRIRLLLVPNLILIWKVGSMSQGEVDIFRVM